jgi:hypothetical protein
MIPFKGLEKLFQLPFFQMEKSSAVCSESVNSLQIFALPRLIASVPSSDIA